jgi:inner membrane protein
VHPIEACASSNEDRSNGVYQVSKRPDGSHQIFAERITGSVGGRTKTQLQTVNISDEEIRPKLLALQSRSPSAQIYLSGSIDIEDPEEVTIESNPQLYPSIVKRGAKLELDLCSLNREIDITTDVWGTG